jgi:drug/metabolite transporter superfamily protein YnfA
MAFEGSIPMNRPMMLVMLLLAAIFEAGGDALVRAGLRTSGLLVRTGFFASGAVVLFGYGYIVNTPPWEFGRLLGIYVVFFFLVAQLISWFIFQQPPTPLVLTGGSFIIVGGLLLSLG